MISKAVARYIRISPRKARLAIDLVRGRHVDEALAILRNTNKKAAIILIKVINSAVANAKRLPHIHTEDLYISKIYADGGPQLKRYKAQAMGRASTIRKRTSYITVEVDLKEHKIAEPAKGLKKPKKE